MTNEETALADKILKEATEAQDPTQRRERIEDYNTLVRAACTRRDAMGSNRPLATTATGMASE